MIFVTLLENQAGDGMGGPKQTPLVAGTRGVSGFGCKVERRYFPALQPAILLPLKLAALLQQICEYHPATGTFTAACTRIALSRLRKVPAISLIKE